MKTRSQFALTALTGFALATLAALVVGCADIGTAEPEVGFDGTEISAEAAALIAETAAMNESALEFTTDNTTDSTIDCGRVFLRCITPDTCGSFTSVTDDMFLHDSCFIEWDRQTAIGCRVTRGADGRLVSWLGGICPNTARIPAQNGQPEQWLSVIPAL